MNVYFSILRRLRKVLPDELYATKYIYHVVHTGYCSKRLSREVNDMTKIELYRISWKSRITGFEGKGKRGFSYDIANDWVIALNKKYPELMHWVSF